MVLEANKAPPPREQGVATLETSKIEVVEAARDGASTREGCEEVEVVGRIPKGGRSEGQYIALRRSGGGGGVLMQLQHQKSRHG